MYLSLGWSPRLRLLKSEARPKPVASPCQGPARLGLEWARLSGLRAWGPAQHITSTGRVQITTFSGVAPSTSLVRISAFPNHAIFGAWRKRLKTTMIFDTENNWLNVGKERRKTNYTLFVCVVSSGCVSKILHIPTAVCVHGSRSNPGWILVIIGVYIIVCTSLDHTVSDTKHPHLHGHVEDFSSFVFDRNTTIALPATPI
jgi:hypothetical protein